MRVSSFATMDGNYTLGVWSSPIAIRSGHCPPLAKWKDVLRERAGKDNILLLHKRFQRKEVHENENPHCSYVSRSTWQHRKENRFLAGRVCCPLLFIEGCRSSRHAGFTTGRATTNRS